MSLPCDKKRNLDGEPSMRDFRVKQDGVSLAEFGNECDND